MAMRMSFTKRDRKYDDLAERWTTMPLNGSLALSFRGPGRFPLSDPPPQQDEE